MRYDLTIFLCFVAFFTATAWFIQSAITLSGSSVGDSVSFEVSPGLSSDKAGFSDLRAAAIQACLCERENKENASCRADYADERKQMLDRVYGEGQRPWNDGEVTATACAPISTVMECFSFTDGEKCLVTEYDVNAASSEIEHRYVCTQEEARAVEAAYMINRDQGDAVLSAILSGETVAAPETTGACAGLP